MEKLLTSTREKGKESLSLKEEDFSSSIPRVALIGRRNVGKSSLLNALCRRRYAITDESPGLTRDILEVELKYHNFHFRIADTPGLDLESLDELDEKIKARTQSYLKNVDLLVLLFAAPEPHPFDLDLINLVRKISSHTPFLFVVNKLDRKEKIAEMLLPFYEAKLGDLIPISARGRLNLDVLLEQIRKKLGGPDPLPSNRQEPLLAREEKGGERKQVKILSRQEKQEEIALAIIGRPNAGKSSLFNCLLGEERSLVSETPGTTRDALDTKICYKGKQIQLIDTAGMRKASRLIGLGAKKRVEFYSMSRTKRAMRQAKIVILLVDGLMGLSDFDKRICSMAQKYKCALLFAISKWDLIKEKYAEEGALKNFQERIRFLFPHLRDLTLVYCSALTGAGTKLLLDTVLKLDLAMDFQLSTSKLNHLFQKWSMHMPKSASKLKIFYATQKEKCPPAFIVFVNDPRLFSPSLSSYFMNCIRKEFNLKGIPFRLYAQKRA